MTTTLSSPSGSPSAIRRAGVTWIGSPIRLSGMRCAAARACTLVTPAITVCSKATFPRSRNWSITRKVES